MAPSIEQCAGALPAAATQRGAARATPATGSPMDETGIVAPSLVLVQSSAVISRLPCAAGVCGSFALRLPASANSTNTISARSCRDFISILNRLESLNVGCLKVIRGSRQKINDRIRQPQSQIPLVGLFRRYYLQVFPRGLPGPASKGPVEGTRLGKQKQGCNLVNLCAGQQIQSQIAAKSIEFLSIRSAPPIQFALK